MHCDLRTGVNTTTPGAQQRLTIVQITKRKARLPEGLAKLAIAAMAPPLKGPVARRGRGRDDRDLGTGPSGRKAKRSVERDARREASFNLA
jgi:hypothetical protein